MLTAGLVLWILAGICFGFGCAVGIYLFAVCSSAFESCFSNDKELEVVRK